MAKSKSIVKRSEYREWALTHYDGRYTREYQIAGQISKRYYGGRKSDAWRILDMARRSGRYDMLVLWLITPEPLDVMINPFN